MLRNPNLEEVFTFVPNNRFFLETDTVAESIEAVYKKASGIKKIAITDLKNQIQKNFKHILNNKL